MLIKGIDNQSVELKITNYQYPQIKNDKWDSNWLNIYLCVKSKAGNWQTVDPSLTTFEVTDLIKWFYDLSQGKTPQEKYLVFTEPNIQIELLNSTEKGTRKFRIKFELESRPKLSSNDKEYFVDCLAGKNELYKISEDLKGELSSYPER